MKNIEFLIPLDPEDERYRKCPYCGYEFMTAHRARKFCSQHCHDHFHVNKRMQASHNQHINEPVLPKNDEGTLHEQEHKEQQQQKENTKEQNIPQYMMIVKLTAMCVIGVALLLSWYSMQQERNPN
ncbi:MAG: hypothetical protein ACKOQ6_04205 [Bacteroidota bacterium]